jgi:farnesol dehydrogenase
MVRPGAQPGTDASGIEWCEGDVTDPDSLLRAAEGCMAIVHAAALVRTWARDPRDFDRVNVGGLEHAIRVAAKVGARLVYVSSFMALGPTDGTVLDEDSPRMSLDFHNDYERSKWLADQRARSAADAEVIRVYPGVVYGPGVLTAGNHVTNLLTQHAHGRLPGLLGRADRRQCLAFVEDVAEGVALATEGGRAGRGYILGGENCTTLELFQSFERVSGIPVPRRRIPFVVAAGLGRLLRWRASLTGILPDLTDEVVGIYRHEWAYSSARAMRELGYRITPLEEGLRQTTIWLRTQKLIAAAAGEP